MGFFSSMLNMQEEEIKIRRMTVNARRISMLLLLILIIGKLSNAYSGGRAAVERCNAASNKEAYFSKTSAAARENMMRGRKMAFDNWMKIEKKVMKYVVSEASLKISGAEKVAIKDKDGAGFVAFNADYKGPRYHPPKNN